MYRKLIAFMGILMVCGNGWADKCTDHLGVAVTGVDGSSKYCYSRQADTIVERIIADAAHAVRNLHRPQSAALVKRMIPNCFHSISYHYFVQGRATEKS